MDIYLAGGSQQTETADYLTFLRRLFVKCQFARLGLNALRSKLNKNKNQFVVILLLLFYPTQSLLQ